MYKCANVRTCERKNKHLYVAYVFEGYVPVKKQVVMRMSTFPPGQYSSNIFVVLLSRSFVEKKLGAVVSTFQVGQPCLSNVSASGSGQRS